MSNMATKVAILGATGPTGQQLVTQALSKGLSVTAVVRNPSKLKTTHENLKIVKADIFDAASLSPHFSGQDAVMSCLGYSGSWWSREPITFYTESMRAIVTAMRESGVKRLLTMTSWCTSDKPDDNPFLYRWIMKPLLLNKFCRDAVNMEEWLFNECTDINSTVVRPPGLTNGNVTDMEITAVEGQYVPGCKLGFSLISRADVARFMLTTLTDNQWDNKGVAIATFRTLTL